MAASEKDIDIAVAAARTAFNTTWGKNVTGFERSKLINKLADLIERDQQELAELESLNNGKPVKIARYQPDKTPSPMLTYQYSGTSISETASRVSVIMLVGQIRFSDRYIHGINICLLSQLTEPKDH